MRVLPLLLYFHFLPAQAKVPMILYHNGNGRTGLNSNETILTPANVNADSFGLLFTRPVDGQVFAQPLVVPGLTIGGAAHDVVFICTENDSVYAFDANDGQPLWHANFLGPGVTPVPWAELASCDDIGLQYGITDTPAIDLSTNTLYVVAETKEVSGGGSTPKPRGHIRSGGLVTQYVHRLHALDLTTGAEKFNGPVAIAAEWDGTGGPVVFNAPQQFNRPGLVLSGGLVYTFWGSHCDDGQYYGWVLAYSAADLSQRMVFNLAPVSERGSVWQSGAPPALDTDGTFFMSTATGPFDAAMGGVDYGESILHFDGSLPGIKDYFSPANEAALDARDDEMGSVGVMILPDEAGSPDHPFLLTGGDKAGDIFLLDRDDLGGFQANPDGTDAVVQEFHAAPMTFFAMFTTPAYYNGNVYWSFVEGPILSYSIANGRYNTTPTSATPESFHFPGCVPSISSNGPNYYGILWAIEPGNPAVLRAYDANNLSIELYDSTFAGARDDIGSPSNKFTPPTVANGKVYVATMGNLAVFGLLVNSQALKTTKTAVKTASTVSPTPTPSPTATPPVSPTPTITPTPTAIPGPAMAVPNPLKAGQVAVTFQVPKGGATLEVDLYDLAGERLSQVKGAPGSSRCVWDAGSAASGLYLARVKVTGVDGSYRRQILKVAVLR